MELIYRGLNYGISTTDVSPATHHFMYRGVRYSAQPRQEASTTSVTFKYRGVTYTR